VAENDFFATANFLKKLSIWIAKMLDRYSKGVIYYNQIREKHRGVRFRFRKE